MASYSKKASSKVAKAMHERKTGTLKSGRSGKTVKSRKQAIAIGLSEARKAGAKVPAKKSSAKKSAAKKSSARRSAAKKSPVKKGASRTTRTTARDR
jgi:hypothetical protein